MKLATIGNEYWMVDDVSGDPLFYVGPAQAPPPSPPPPPPGPPPWYQRRIGLPEGLGRLWPSGEGIGQWLDRRAMMLPAPSPVSGGMTANLPSLRGLWAPEDWTVGPTGEVNLPQGAAMSAQEWLEAWQAENRARIGLPPLGSATAGTAGQQVWGAARPGAGAYAPESDIYAGQYGTPLAPAPTDGEEQYTPLAVLNAQARARAAAAAGPAARAAQGWQQEWPNPPAGYRLPDPGRPGQYRSQAETETWWQAFRADPRHKGMDPITWYASNPLNIRPGATYEPRGPLSGYQAAALQSAESDWDWAQGIRQRNIDMGRGDVGPSPGEWEQHWYESRGRPTPEQEQEQDWARGEAYQAQRAAAEAAERQAREAERRFREAALPYTSTRWDRW